MSSVITKAKAFDATKITYKAATTNKRGGKAVQIQLNGQPLVLQIPLMLTWGLNERVDEDSGRVSYDMALQFQPEKHTSIEKFLSAMKTLEDKIKDDCVSHSKDWFGKKTMSREVVDVMMYPVLKYPKTKEADGSYGDPDPTRDPTLKLKVPFWEGKFNVELYDMERKALYVPVKNKDEVGVQGTKTPMDFIPKGTSINGLIGCTGLWFAGGRCGVTWKLIQACVRPPVRLVGTGTCHVEADSDDEELLDSLQKNDQSKDEDTSTQQPTFVDSDEEDEDEEEVDEPEPAPEPPKKKKVVRRKKIVKKKD
tara:strand:+ start:441 stop:1367 length:927 start_codon:yes stop_codon:yes gene_type:complete